MNHLMFKITHRDNRTIGIDIGDSSFVINAFHCALEKAGAHIRRTVEYDFHPQGLTAVAILAESHAVIQTWPELGYALVDYFSCAVKPGFEEFTQYFRDLGFFVIDNKILGRG